MKKKETTKKVEGGDQVDTAKLTKETIKKIKECIKQLAEKVASLESNDDKVKAFDECFKENNVEVDQKYLILINVLFDKNIYAEFRAKGPVIKHFINQEVVIDEAMYHFVTALIDLLYNKCKGDNLNKYVSSIVYLAYEIDLITEEFFTKYALSNMRYMPQKQSLFANQEIEEKFFNDLADFKNWLRTAPYEDEEYSTNEVANELKTIPTKEIEQKHEKKVLKDEDIDDI